MTNVTDANKVGLVERIVIGKKRVSASNPDTGEPYFAYPGDTVWVQPHTAKNFAHCLGSKEVVEAEAAAEVARAKAEAGVVETTTKPAPANELKTPAKTTGAGS